MHVVSFLDAFMVALEKDAAERAENRRKNKIRADEFKGKGNDAFHQERYDEAIEHYTEVNRHRYSFERSDQRSISGLENQERL